MHPETRYAKSGDVNIAYQVVGAGPIDLVFVMGWVSHLDYFWTEPRFARFLGRLASFSRLILFDKRGTGLSDRVAQFPTLEQRMDDVRAVMDAVGSERAALLGISEGGSLGSLFAATYPERTAALVMLGCFARRMRADDHPWGTTPEQRDAFLAQVERGWGGPVGLAARAPSLAGDPRFIQWWATYLRMSASPGAATMLTGMNMEIDMRHVLPTVRVPTLIIHRVGDRAIPVESSRYMAERIAGATYVELPGDDHLPFVGDQDSILDQVEQFLTGVRTDAQPDRVLATVLVGEIHAAPATAARLGDRRWREAVEAYHGLVRRELARFRGREARSTEGSFLASFDGPTRAINCAMAIVEAARPLGVDARCGLHSGECELGVGDVSGVAVDLALRVMAHAGSGEVLVSGTVKELVTGSGIEFEELGSLPVTDLPGGWRLLRVLTDSAAPLPSAGTLPASLTPRPGRLTAREREVAALVALGLTNRQIAEELTVSVSTAERHIANIRGKLGLHSRVQLAGWAVEQGLLRERSTAPRMPS